ncbi:MAG: cysteine desulfurase [Gammaproteobacteria bacterium]|nr:cysteine desulfurase [Gammaproteobacteria bacterium]
MPVYLDHNATTPLDERVLQAMLPYLREHYGNPSGVHAVGRMARAAIDQAREQVAALVNAHPSQVVFTGGGTEANNLALKGVAARMVVGRIAVSAIEHASLLGPVQALARQGWGVDSIAVDDQCRILPSSLSEALNNRPRLVSVMMANNETGAIQGIATIGAQARAAGAVMHTDASQAAGKIPVDFFACGAHLMTLSAHKIYGPKGVGALIVDKALEIEPLLHGGGHEMGRRGGTENVAGIVGFGAAAELACNELTARGTHLRGLREMLEAQLRAVPGVVVFAADAERLPNTVMIAVAGIDGEMLLMNLDRKGIAVSSGSACASGSGKPSHVLLAMGVAEDLARGAIRISLGKDNTRWDVESFVAVLREQIGRLQAPSVSAWA